MYHFAFRLIASALLFSLSSELIAQPVSDTSFTYQGFLEQNGVGVTAQCDFQFGLWTGNNAPTTGSQVGSDVQQTAIVDEGIFTAELDFGADALNGSARWLNIEVCCPSGCAPGYTELVPRQALTSAPFSVQTRGVFVDAGMNVGIKNTSPTATLSVGTGDGASVNVGAQPQLNLTKDLGDQKMRMQITGSGYGGYDLQIGRDDEGHGLILAGDQIQSGDAIHHGDSIRFGDVGISGSLGVGDLDPDPQTSLHVNAADDNFGVLVEAVSAESSRIGLHAGSSGFSSLAKNAYFDGGWQRFDTGFGAYLQEVEPDGDTTFNSAPAGSNPINWNRAMVIKPSGRIGMGTNNPAEQLHVNGSAIVEGTTDIGLVWVRNGHPNRNYIVASCPADTRILAGGCHGANIAVDAIEDSYPSFNTNEWQCWWESSGLIYAWALCGRVSVGYIEDG